MFVLRNCASTCEYRVAQTYLTRAPDLDPAVLQHHLTPMCQPADHARYDKKHGEEVHRESWSSRIQPPRSCEGTALLTHSTVNQAAVAKSSICVTASASKNVPPAVESTWSAWAGIAKGTACVPEINIWSQLPFDEVFVLHGRVVQRHRGFQ